MRRISLFAICVVLCLSRSMAVLASPLAERLEPFLAVVRGDAPRYTFTADLKLQVDGKPQSGKVTLCRDGEQSFYFALDHDKYAVTLVRQAGQTALSLPCKGVRFVGEGAAASSDTLNPAVILEQLFGDGTSIGTHYQLIRHADALTAATALEKLAGLQSVDGITWTIKGRADTKITFAADHSLTIEAGPMLIHASVTAQSTPAPAPAVDLKTQAVNRQELERLISRGVRRALEVAAPSPLLTSPAHTARVVPHGELRWESGQRLVLLSGSPTEIGTAHGQLLKDEAKRCRDSAIYLVGLVATVDRGAWFPDELREAYRRLEPHIPRDHKAETDALADAAGLTRDEARLSNVFPELFHCSGFALFGKATVDGKLYHGRVLDYMTTIGLQDTATTFIIAPAGKIPFANIGYAGFVGSVSGMNAQQISLGEMGGRGQGQWDGTPMSTLMRRALEECSTLDQVKHLWSSSPRTCEYYYVFADGKGPDAVACAATPEHCDFLKPGEAHELLGAGIPDAVVLSAGGRLTELRKRVQEGYGTFDAVKAMSLMCRPVAMNSNLHDVLFVPQDGVFYVANADHHSPAAERPYVKYNLNALLASMTKVSQARETFKATDVPLDLRGATGQAREWLQGFEHPIETFTYTTAPLADEEDFSVIQLTFPSPMTTPFAMNDIVPAELYLPKRPALDADGKMPATIVLDILDGRALLPRMTARVLASRGIAAMYFPMPYYNVRRPPGNAHMKLLDQDPQRNIVPPMRQLVMDVRRAKAILAVQPRIDAHRIGITGISLGGISASLAAGVDGTFYRVAPVLAGGDLATLIFHAREMRGLRQVLERHGIDQQAAATLLAPIEPLNFAGRIDPHACLMINASQDEVIPQATTLALSKAIGGPTLLWMPAGHYSGVLHLPNMQQRIADFMLGEDVRALDAPAHANAARPGAAVTQ